MSVQVIKAFADKARTDPQLKEDLLGCLKVKDLLLFAKAGGFAIDEEELYPPNEPQFTAEQLSERLGKALLRV